MKFFYLSKFNYFQKDPSECELSIHTAETPSLILFPPEYLGKIAFVSIVSPSSPNYHQYLNLNFISKFNKSDFKTISNKQIAFKIISMEIKLDFLGISLVNEDDYSNQSNAYEIHSARLLLKIEDPSGIVEKIIISKMFRNKNFCVSEDISVSTIGKNLLNPPGVVILLANPVPYFPFELIVTISNQTKPYTLENKKMFPADRFYIICRENIDYNRVIIKCPYFDKSWTPAPSIDERKLKQVPTNRGLCILINQIEFQDSTLTIRTLGNNEDKERIKKVFDKLGYEFKILENLTTNALKEALCEIIKKIKICQETIVIFLSSHGDENGFCTYDGFMSFKNLREFFLPENFPNSAKTQKIFFYSCCLGNEKNITNESLPKFANFLIGFSTVPGCSSYRSNDGTAYFQTLLDVIEEDPLLEVKEIQSETQRRLGGKPFPGFGFLVPSVNECLTKPTYF